MEGKITFTVHRLNGVPQGIHGSVLFDGKQYTIILNAEESPAQQYATFLHEMAHIYNGDLIKSGGNAGEIENRTHKQLLEALELLKQQDEQEEQEIQNEIRRLQTKTNAVLH